jgi:hypothetical protein
LKTLVYPGFYRKAPEITIKFEFYRLSAFADLGGQGWRLGVNRSESGKNLGLKSKKTFFN